MINAVVIALAESAEGGGHSAADAYLIGGATLALLVGLLVALVAFGGGREHS